MNWYGPIDTKDKELNITQKIYYQYQNIVSVPPTCLNLNDLLEVRTLNDSSFGSNGVSEEMLALWLFVLLIVIRSNDFLWYHSTLPTLLSPCVRNYLCETAQTGCSPTFSMMWLLWCPMYLPNRPNLLYALLIMTHKRIRVGIVTQTCCHMYHEILVENIIASLWWRILFWAYIIKRGSRWIILCFLCINVSRSFSLTIPLVERYNNIYGERHVHM